MIKINTSGDYVQLIYVDAVGQSVQQELKSDTDAFECSYDSEGKLYMQFGLMRFENPDPTDFTINGSAVTDAADFISKLNALFTGGGGGGGGWGTSGTIATLTGDSIVNLNGHNFQLLGNGNLFAIYTLATTELAYLKAYSSEADFTSEITVYANSGNGYKFYLLSANGINNVEIEGNSDENNREYTAGTHTFIGINEFVDDAAAAAGGVPVNGLYHSMGTVKIRLS